MWCLPSGSSLCGNLPPKDLRREASFRYLFGILYFRRKQWEDRILIPMWISEADRKSPGTTRVRERQGKEARFNKHST
jgi:hypothetical protein